jgi:hypothetical protein
MNHQASRTLQETKTALAPAEVLDAAKRFFARRNSIYAAFLEKEGPSYVNLRGMGGEEVVIGVATVDGQTVVTGSTYLFDQQVARFFSTLAPAGQPPVGQLPSGEQDLAGTASTVAAAGAVASPGTPR